MRELRRAVARGALTSDGFAVCEGPHLLDEALRSHREIKLVLASEAARLEARRVIRVREDVFRLISSTENSQGVVALVRPPGWTLEQLLGENPLLVVLDGVQDPGNAGAIVRAAEAFGATGAAFLKGSVNPWNPKCLRAAAGSLFRLPVVQGLEDDVLLAALAGKRVSLYAAMPRGSRVASEVDLASPCALIIGGEGAGVSLKLRAKAEEVRIPTSGVESLNAAVAAAILLYEARRQRLW